MEESAPKAKGRITTIISSRKFRIASIVTAVVILLVLSAIGGYLVGSRSGQQADNSSSEQASTGKECTYNDVKYMDGEGFDSIDGCNSCSCEDGEVICTLLACEEDLPVVSSVDDNGSDQASSYTAETEVTCSWEARGAQSYTVSLGTSPGATDVAQATVAGGQTSHVFDAGYYSKVGVYYCSVQAHADDKKSDLVSSDGIFIDVAWINNPSIPPIGASFKENCTIASGSPMSARNEDIEVKVWAERIVNGQKQYSHEPDGNGWTTEFKSYTIPLTGSNGYECSNIFTYEDTEYDTATIYARFSSKHTGRTITETSRKVTGEIQGSGLKY